jgi:aryl-alcohol dehydrogenase-like predicted oxidoreductase
MTKRSLSRRQAAGLLGAASLALPFAAHAQAPAPLLKRPIPHGNGEMLPVVGLGTVLVFNVGSTPKDIAGPTEVVKALADGGGTLIDSAPSYGAAEAVIGNILSATKLRPRLFLATKLEEYRPGNEAAEAKESLQRLGTDKVDLLQLHNVKKADQDMGGVNALKAQGLCRYTGLSTTFARDYDAVEAVVKRAKPDFLEIDYALDNRKAEERVLPAAIDSGTAVLVALPFGRGRLFKTALGKPLPEWASEFDCASWGQFFLKFLLGHPAITAVIPGTTRADHMVDNLAAGRGRLPDAKQRARMIQYVESLG